MDDNNHRSADRTDPDRSSDVRLSDWEGESRFGTHASNSRRERRKEKREQGRPASHLPPELSERALEPLQIITLPADEIVMDSEWNARSEGKLGTAEESTGYADLGEALTDEQLRDDIAQRGLLQPVRVRLVDDEWHLVFGFRRLRACLSLDLGMPVICTVQPCTDDEEADDLEAAIANLSENQHRRELRTFEIANKLWEIHQQMPPGTTYVGLAACVNYSVSYVSSLMRMKKNACSELWTLFCKYGARYGNGVTYKDMLDITKEHAKDEQLKAWEKLMEERVAGVAGKGGGGRKKSGGNKRRLELALKRVERLHHDTDVKYGMRLILRVVFKACTWKELEAMPSCFEKQALPTKTADDVAEPSNSETPPEATKT